MYKNFKYISFTQTSLVKSNWFFDFDIHVILKRKLISGRDLGVALN